MATKNKTLMQFGVQLGKVNLNFNGGYQHHFYDYDNGAFSDGTYRNNDEQIFGGLNAITNIKMEVWFSIVDYLPMID
jgi:hypothetical protein